MKIDEKILLPNFYTQQYRPNFTGRGKHTIQELENLCEKFKEYTHQQNLIKNKICDMFNIELINSR
jgi:hypothetical protein